MTGNRQEMWVFGVGAQEVASEQEHSQLGAVWLRH